VLAGGASGSAAIQQGSNTCIGITACRPWHISNLQGSGMPRIPHYPQPAAGNTPSVVADQQWAIHCVHDHQQPQCFKAFLSIHETRTASAVYSRSG
jgi:hypothetical protein